MGKLSERLRERERWTSPRHSREAMTEAADALDEAEALLERWVAARVGRAPRPAWSAISRDTRSLLARLKGGES